MLVSLVQVMLVRLLPSSAPNSSQGDDGITQGVLQKCYLPFAAATSSVEDNAKVAMCVETLVRVYVTSGGEIDDFGAFEIGLEKGIKAREEKATLSGSGPGRKRGGRGTTSGRGDERADLQAMKMSAERMRGLIRLLKAKAKVG